MTVFTGEGFRVEANGAIKRDFDATNMHECRRARESAGCYVKGLSDRLSAGQALSEPERVALKYASALITELSATMKAQNEAERAEAARIAGGGRVDPDTQASDSARRLAGFRGASAEDDLSRARPASDRRYSAMFGASARGFDGWDDGKMPAATAFCRTVALGLHDSRLRAASMSGNEGGGYAIPPGVFGPWLDQALESEIVRSRAQVWPILQGRERTVPAWDLHDRSSGLAGFAIDWEGENPAADASPQVGVTRGLKLYARRGSIFASASNELVQDGFDFDAQLSMIMSAALGYGLDRSFLFGTGAESPLGIFNSPALISVTRAVSNQISYDDLLNMFARVSPASIANSVWLAHSSTIPMLGALTVPVGTGGSHVPVMSESAGQFRILTRPVIFSEKVKPLGQLGDLALLDFSRYAIGMRQDATLDKSIHVGFLKNLQYFRLQIRIDGQPVDAAPTQPPNSAPTQSPFVALAA